MTTLIKTKRKNHPVDRKKATLRPLVSNEPVTITGRWSAPAGTNQAKTPESTKTLPERIEAKTAPSTPAPTSKRHQKMKQFSPFFNETNQPRLCQKRLLHCVQDHIWNIVVEEGVVFGS